MKFIPYPIKQRFQQMILGSPIPSENALLVFQVYIPATRIALFANNGDVFAPLFMSRS